MERKRYTQGFKDDCVNFYLKHEGNKSLLSIANDLGISDNTLSNWVRKYKKTNSTNNVKVDNNEIIIELRLELKAVKEERDVLKKALAIFINN